MHLPAFVSPVAFDEFNPVKLHDKMKTWAIFSQAVRTMGERDLLRVIMLELRGERRELIVKRALSRYQRLRDQRELAEVCRCTSVAHR